MKKLLGLVFLVAAALVLYFGSVGWPSLDVNLWSLIPVGLFLYFTLENLLKKDYKASLMCLIIAFIIANAILDLLPISSGLVIGAGVIFLDTFYNACHQFILVVAISDLLAFGEIIHISKFQ